MGIDKGWMAGSTAMLLLRLLEERDRYGYQTVSYTHLTLPTKLEV